MIILLVGASLLSAASTVEMDAIPQLARILICICNSIYFHIRIDDKVVSTFLEVDSCTQKEVVELCILRDGEELNLKVPTAPLTAQRNSIIHWAGTEKLDIRVRISRDR